ncbi:MAG: pyrroloquinoline quinone biosynthesis protein PqqB [Paracoccaceae bacterium]
MSDASGARGRSRLRAVVVGAAAGGGLPQWNCNGPGGRPFWTGAARMPPATQSSLAVGLVDGRDDDWREADKALINASPDLRAQIMARPALQPRDPDRFGLRDSPIASVLLTNGDIDHVAGLLTLREGQAFRLLATPGIHDVLRANPIFEALSAVVTREAVGLGEPFALLDGVEARLFAVPGKVPLYLEGETVETDLQGEQTVGVEIRAGGKRIAYVPGCARMTGRLAERLSGADVVLFDGTVFEDDEMRRAGVGTKTGRRMGHMAMNGADGSLAAFRDIDVGRRIFVHMNNTNPVWDPGSEARATVEAAGWEIAHDGMEIDP